MSVESQAFIALQTIFLLCVLLKPCDAIKCFDCNSANNSACLDLRSPRMHAIIPVVDCTHSMPNEISHRDFFCRKISQTILHADKSPEVRVTRGCGWVKHRRECYKADNEDHLELVCQCFGDMCNAAAALRDVKMTVLGILTSFLLAYKSCREKVWYIFK